MEQIGNNHNTMWGSVYKAIKTEWDFAFAKDPISFKVSRKTVCTDQLLWIMVAVNVRNIYPQEHEADIDGGWKALVWSLKQFHTCYYKLCKKGITHSMVGLQSLHLCDALKHPSISAGI